MLKLLRIRGKVLNGYKDRFERVASGAIGLKRGGAKQLVAAKMGRRHKEHPLTRNLRPGHLVDGIIKLASINKDNHDTRSSYALTFELEKRRLRWPKKLRNDSLEKAFQINVSSKKFHRNFLIYHKNCHLLLHFFLPIIFMLVSHPVDSFLAY